MKKFMDKFLIQTALVMGFVAICMTVLAQAAFADGVAVTLTAPAIGDALAQLFAAIKDHGSVAVIIMAVVQILKTNEVLGILGKVSSKALPLIIAVVTTVGYVVAAVIAGKSWFQGAIEGLFTSGGAMLIYEGFRKIKVEEASSAETAAKIVK